MSCSKTDSIPKTTAIFSGLITRNTFRLLRESFSPSEVSYHKTYFPIWKLVRVPPDKTYSPIKKFTKKTKAFLLLCSKNPSLIFTNNYLSIRVKISYSDSTLNDFRTKLDELIGRDNIFIFRNLGVLGFTLQKLDLSLEYDLFRNIDKFQIILIEGKLVCPSKTFHSELLKNKFENANFSEEELKVVKETYLPVLLNTSINSYRQAKPNLDSNLLVKGELKNLFDHDHIEVKLPDRWKYRKFEKSEVLHGQIVKIGNHFFLPDPKRHSEWGKDMNLIPGIIFQSKNLNWFSPRPVQIQGRITEAIFLGGTNNLMHTVLEELPRIIFSDFLKIDQSVPLLISSQLSHQIVDLIRHISSRECIKVDLYSSINVDVLHFFQFDSPLQSVMGGDHQLGEELFSSEIAGAVKMRIHEDEDSEVVPNKRILVLREPGLFRPVTNIQKIKKFLVNEFGFTSLYMSNLDYRSVRSIFSSASIVVGEYGAALANVIHMQEGSSVVEIRGPLEAKASEYEILIKGLNLRHSLLIGNLKQVSRFGVSKGPYSIPTKALRRNVEGMIEGAI